MLDHNNYLVVKFSTLRFSTIRIVKTMKWPNLSGWQRKWEETNVLSDWDFDWIKLRIILIVYAHICEWVSVCIYNKFERRPFQVITIINDNILNQFRYMLVRPRWHDYRSAKKRTCGISKSFHIVTYLFSFWQPFFML